MLDKVIDMRSFSEKKASNYLKIMLSALSYMHSINIVHRDMKAQNMVFDKAGKDAVLHIIDFGDCLIVQDGHTYEEFVGTIHYVESEASSYLIIMFSVQVPPEIVRKRSKAEMLKGDMWAVGVIGL